MSLTDQDKSTLRTAAFGAVTLISAADATGAPHKAATQGSVALATATGLIGHVLAEKTRDIKLNGKSVAAIAEYVLPALTASMRLLKQQAPAEAANFRSTVVVAVEAASQGRPSPTLTEMSHKITEALDAA